MSRVINKVAVIGSGTMGSGIAALLAGAGLQVRLLDIVPPDLTEAEKQKGLTRESDGFRNRFAYGTVLFDYFLRDSQERCLGFVGVRDHACHQIVTRRFAREHVRNHPACT